MREPILVLVPRQSILTKREVKELRQDGSKVIDVDCAVCNQPCWVTKDEYGWKIDRRSVHVCETCCRRFNLLLRQLDITRLRFVRTAIAMLMEDGHSGEISRN